MDYNRPTIRLGNEHLGNEGARALLDSPNLANLVSLGLEWDKSRLSPGVKRALRRRFGERLSV